MLVKGQMMPEKRRMPAVINTNDDGSAATRIQMNAEKSVTLSGQAGGMGGKTGLYFYENMGVRRLTPTECCRLQGFPDDWNDNCSDGQRYRQMGNAVTVNVIEWIGKRIMEVEHG
jgi:DNA (cytosine-5)-methyltransferase 1